eukprot:CAMPEP_0168756744 /NCGR_PEP_ID=MMETSP0724-20121128/20782_1 /TAXON_ID=265536 /ORGANISM="Amphiprora sp., Strain CCMP467" /LENGTH=568 /DNA_ID=CAMNT_0008805479 /DNA_START=22 /DNA_END=1729 /DNA_ORIENTATION=+
MTSLQSRNKISPERGAKPEFRALDCADDEVSNGPEHRLFAAEEEPHLESFLSQWRKHLDQKNESNLLVFLYELNSVLEKEKAHVSSAILETYLEDTKELLKGKSQKLEVLDFLEGTIRKLQTSEDDRSVGNQIDPEPVKPIPFGSNDGSGKSSKEKPDIIFKGEPYVLSADTNPEELGDYSYLAAENILLCGIEGKPVKCLVCRHCFLVRKHSTAALMSAGIYQMNQHLLNECITLPADVRNKLHFLKQNRKKGRRRSRTTSQFLDYVWNKTTAVIIEPSKISSCPDKRKMPERYPSKSEPSPTTKRPPSVVNVDDLAEDSDTSWTFHDDDQLSIQTLPHGKRKFSGKQERSKRRRSDRKSQPVDRYSPETPSNNSEMPSSTYSPETPSNNSEMPSSRPPSLVPNDGHQLEKDHTTKTAFPKQPPNDSRKELCFEDSDTWRYFEDDGFQRKELQAATTRLERAKAAAESKVEHLEQVLRRVSVERDVLLKGKNEAVKAMLTSQEELKRVKQGLNSGDQSNRAKVMLEIETLKSEKKVKDELLVKQLVENAELQQKLDDLTEKLNAQQT